MIFVTGAILLILGAVAAEQFDTSDPLQKVLAKACAIFAVLGGAMMLVSVLMFLAKWLP